MFFFYAKNSKNEYIKFMFYDLSILNQDINESVNKRCGDEKENVVKIPIILFRWDCLSTCEAENSLPRKGKKKTKEKSNEKKNQ